MQERIEAFIQAASGRAGSGRASGSDDAFETLALEVFAYQYERCAAYRSFCERRGRTPEDVRSTDEVPALPAEAFKSPLGLPDRRPFVFESSGTTAGKDRRSRHELRSLSTYRLSSLTHFERLVLPDRPGPLATLVLGPSSATHPTSSLGQMFAWCAESFGDGVPCVCFDSRGRVDIESALAWLREAARATRPVLLLSIGSALTALFTAMRERRLYLRLPADSRVVDTGGRKGDAPVFSASGMLKAAWRYLHVPAYQCLNEYGMTELLSQFYDDALLSRTLGRLSPRAKLGPAWVRSIVVDPAGLRPLPEGERGILRHFDLANWDTVSCVQTLDVGRGSGQGFELCGRLPLAESRGCSQLMVSLDALTSR